ncbi:tyrosine-protein phosphatase 10D-like [Panonychus citri]|uniref:tyrosine-protein phosphatase 10D-like n=1 Tax=Panonychus citri TaxID=50023 RepID=UPI0023081A13|nr:tyrosine-protein phosphatase 10D-like [Panonychus citri]
MITRNFLHYCEPFWIILFSFILVNHHAVYIWAQSLTAPPPNPPRDLQIEVVSGKIVHLDWSPPTSGSITGYGLTIVPLSEQDETGIRNLQVAITDDLPLTLRDLTPGGTYEIQLQSVSVTLNDSIPKSVPKDAPRMVTFNENLEPGKTYEVVVKTVSDNVASWPVTVTRYF